MAATALAAAVPYTSRGTSKTYWCTAIANIAAPTAAELNAGKDITAHITDLGGFSMSSDQIDVVTMDSRVTTKIAGPITIEDSSLTMIASKNGIDVSTLLPMDVAGFVVHFPGGITAGYKMSVWPVTVASNSVQMSAQGSDPNTRLVQFAPTASPALDIAVPAGL
jgi:hypothetical protein